MCLEMTASIAADAKGRVSAERLSQITGLSVSSGKADGRPVLHFAVTGGCSCEFLSDDAEFECETWALSAPHLPALSEAVSLLHLECDKFSFIAHWLGGQPPARTQNISGAALAKLMVNNELGNNIVYVVG